MDDELNETEEMLRGLPLEPDSFYHLREFVEDFYSDPDNRIAVTLNPDKDKVTVWFCGGGCLIFPVSAARGDIAPFCS